MNSRKPVKIFDPDDLDEFEKVHLEFLDVMAALKDLTETTTLDDIGASAGLSWLMEQALTRLQEVCLGLPSPDDIRFMLKQAQGVRQ